MNIMTSEITMKSFYFMKKEIIHVLRQNLKHLKKKKRDPFVLMHKEPTFKDTPQDLTTRQYYIQDASPVTCDIQTSHP